MPEGADRHTAAEALGSVRDSTVRILRHPANRGRRGRALGLYVSWQVWERVVRRPWTIRLGTARRLRLHPHGRVASLVLYCRVPDYEEMSFIRDYLQPGDLFVDVGANVGVYSLWASETDGVDILAFEPSRATHRRTLENVELNGLSDRVEVRRLSVGAVSGEVRLTTGLDAVNRVVVEGAGAERAVEVVEQTTLDAELLPGSGGLAARGPAFVKIDVEGAELDVLRGGRQTIARHRPALLIEVNDPAGLAGLLAELGYRPWAYDPASRALRPTRVGARPNVLALADVDRARDRLAQGAGPPAYARQPVGAASVSPPAPRTPLPPALKSLVLRRLPGARVALLRRDLLRQTGWARSGREDAPVAADGSPLPWYTYPAIHFLGPRLRPDMEVFEYGSGHSTLWWAERVASVLAVEDDPDWVARLTPRLPANVDLRHRPAGPDQPYARAAAESGRRFDVVIIDGEDRSECARACLPALKDDGIIVWDNSDWTGLWADGMRHLDDGGFRRIDLRGLGPLNSYEWTTSVFYRPGHNCLGI